MRILLLTLMVTGSFVAGPVSANDTYKVDPTHASIGFSVGHLVISNVKGQFTDFDATLVLGDAGQLVSAEVVIKASSIDTNNKKRDDHLRNPDFFDATKYPEIRFKSKGIKQRGGKDVLVGQFTIRNVTKTIEIPFRVKGPVKDPWGNTKLGFQAEATINRKDYGVAWNAQMESGGLVVGEEVKLTVDIEFSRQN